jgi:hypothetical protein
MRVRLTDRVASITIRIDGVAEEFESIDPRIALALDRVSDQLEGKPPAPGVKPPSSGKPTAPGSKLNVKMLKPENLEGIKVKINMRSGVMVDRRILTAEFMAREAGLSSVFKELFNKGKRAWENAWGAVKDKALRAQILALKTKEDLTNFTNKNPSLKWAVFAAIMLGVLVFPQLANAGIINAPDVTTLASNLDFSFVGTQALPTAQVNLNPDWIKDVVQRSMENTNGNFVDALLDLHTNVKNILDVKMTQLGLSPEVIHSDKFKETYLEVFKFIANAAKKLLI